MLNFKIKQSLFNPTIHNHLNLTKFCYLMFVFISISCGNETKLKADGDNIENKTVETESTENESNKTILFFGDSITAGYGLDDTNDAFPGLIQKKIDSLGLDYVVVNSGVSGETTAGGKSRIDWILNQDIDIFILELGANDGLRGVAIAETRANLQAIIDAVKNKSPDTRIILAGIQLPPNMGQEYSTQFKAIFPDLASQNNIELIPFVLKDVGGLKELNQADGIHPTAQGHKIVAENVWEVLSEVIKSEAS